jgi:anti-sigma regulatory factor (Ser/Thr protein kinase)
VTNCHTRARSRSCTFMGMNCLACQRTGLTDPVWPLVTHLELGAFPSAVPCARGHVRTVVHEWDLGESADTAELLASELTTNAVQASQRLEARADPVIVPVVRFWLLSDLASLVIRVWDGNDQMPVRRDADLGQEGGRGLMLVESLAAEWGASREANGKVVWALINLR